MPLWRYRRSRFSSGLRRFGGPRVYRLHKRRFGWEGNIARLVPPHRGFTGVVRADCLASVRRYETLERRAGFGPQETITQLKSCTSSDRQPCPWSALAEGPHAPGTRIAPMAERQRVRQDVFAQPRPVADVAPHHRGVTGRCGFPSGLSTCPLFRVVAGTSPATTR